MKITRRDFLRTSFWSVISFFGASLQPRLNKSLNNTPNVIVLVFDTLSARHLSLYGYQRLTTPHLTQFAEKATVYHRHYAAGNFTSPGTASLLTGLYPWTHRAFEQAGIVSKKLVEQNLFRALEHSYQKAAFTQNLWADLFLYQFQEHIDVHFKSTAYSAEDDIYYNSPLWQKDALLTFRAFDDFLEQPVGVPASPYLYFIEKLKRYLGDQSRLADLRKDYPRGIPNLGKYKLYFVLEKVFEGITQEISSLQPPFVGYFHFFPPHEPYFPNRRFIGVFNDGWRPAPKPLHRLSSDVPEEQLNQARREYDEYIADVDANFGQLYLHLQETGVLDNSYLIVTSDHGQLFERGVHGHVTPLLYDPVIHIPLIVSAPRQSEHRDVYSPTSCVDILPTLLKITGSPLPDWLEGNPLPGFQEKAMRKQPVFAMEAKQNSSFKPLTRATFAMIKGDYKLIWYLGYPGYDDVYELYNLTTDPEELLDLSLSEREILLPMANELKVKLARADQL